MTIAAIAGDMKHGEHAANGHQTTASFTAGKLEITDARLRATPPNAKVAAGYLTVRNEGDEADRIIGGSAPFAEKVEIHEMTVEDGVMKMRPLVDGLPIAPGETVELKPGSYHIMLMDLEGALKEGETRPLTIEFEKAGAVSLELPVAPFRPSHQMGHSDKEG
ncbi:copper chaperone PCu(A)C [Notoacmeibacter ruber]|uniref:Copper chaperone PCu(A)C n=2 Tax=Notoacmeibacter ruber TaxID=2670375 RepID=A0A3L7JFN0_9HYPH|nr:copper chaperone PCu(A)C [Notoacmeibacter ruber]